MLARVTYMCSVSSNARGARAVDSEQSWSGQDVVEDGIEHQGGGGDQAQLLSYGQRVPHHLRRECQPRQSGCKARGLWRPGQATNACGTARTTQKLRRRTFRFRISSARKLASV